MWKKEEIIWLAGLLEGEGCFTEGTRGPSGRKFPRISLSMTDEDVVRQAHAVARFGNVVFDPRKEDHWKDQWRWSVQAEAEAYTLMVAIYPWMGKRRRARIRELIELFKSHDLDDWQKAPPGTKWCPVCQEYRPQDKFSPNNCKPDGRAGYCRRCRRKQYRQKKGITTPEDFKDQILLMRSQGKTLKDIAQTTNFHYTTISKALKRWAAPENDARSHSRRHRKCPVV